MRRIGALICALLVGGCDQAPPAPPQPPPTAGEVRQVIAANVRRQGELLLIRDPLLRTLIVVPASAPWAVQCGPVGIKVVFANGVDTNMQTRIRYFLGSPEVCSELAPAVARALQEVISGHNQQP